MSIRQKTVQLSNNDDAHDYESDGPSAPPTPTEETTLLSERAATPPPLRSHSPTPSPEKPKLDLRVTVMGYVSTAVKSVPAVLLGSLLNILDGVSCMYLLSPSCEFLSTERRWHDHIPRLWNLRRVAHGAFRRLDVLPVNPPITAYLHIGRESVPWRQR